MQENEKSANKRKCNNFQKFKVCEVSTMNAFVHLNTIYVFLMLTTSVFPPAAGTYSMRNFSTGSSGGIQVARKE